MLLTEIGSGGSPIVAQFCPLMKNPNTSLNEPTYSLYSSEPKT